MWLQRDLSVAPTDPAHAVRPFSAHGWLEVGCDNGEDSSPSPIHRGDAGINHQNQDTRAHAYPLCSAAGFSVRLVISR